ncbi:hypothetical protein Q4E93_21050 [Flavitalea sp. BT771]|uniref:hypothetical protein n=1 Tax=Flavitalea sp. BT771 TaxID=3063329 RepID=UPI0026E3DCB1|nr:hypothetical protein [Flavitalea sp. BT771]MDO6433110.1 hypothetical protein [Flavitalea sp. BT771]MDV6221614.1 hypothetical protein [Flavitalea sp. BT771]
MKKAIVYSVIAVLCASVQGQIARAKTITGAWINVNVAGFYESGEGHDCSIKYFDHEKFLPLYLSFENDNQVKVTFRIEQRVFTYKVAHTGPDSMSISREDNVYSLYLVKEALKLRYKGDLITFKKVSENYSADVFGEFIKGIVFRDNKTYKVASFIESGNYGNWVFDKSNFKLKIKALFKCDHVDVVQLGSFKFQNTCLPEIALYYDSNSKWSGPRVLGIIINKDAIRFIDNKGGDVLTLKPG